MLGVLAALAGLAWWSPFILLFSAPWLVAIGLLLERFRHAIESVGDDLFWDSRRAHRLKVKPESIAQATRDALARGGASGPARAARFTWNECARRHDVIYRELAG